MKCKMNGNEVDRPCVIRFVEKYAKEMMMDAQEIQAAVETMRTGTAVQAGEEIA